MFNFVKSFFSNIYNQFSKIKSLFSRSEIDQDAIVELEKILISADAGVKTTKIIIDEVKNRVKSSKITGIELRDILKNKLSEILSSRSYDYSSNVYIMVGINGSGKTTFSGKLAKLLKSQGKKVLLVAADTFRAAAKEQLNSWAKQLDIDILIADENSDPASVVFEGCQKYLNNNYDVMIVDTAGRLQNKSNLMKELEKINKVINKKLENQKISTLITIDSMLGQNSFDQVKMFKECTNLDGVVLTKMDGTGKGAIIFSVIQELSIPIAFISFGESVEDVSKFDQNDYLNGLFL